MVGRARSKLLSMEWRGRIGPMDEVTLSEAAELLHLRDSRVADLVEAGVLPARTDCSVIRISLGDIEVYRRRFESPLIGPAVPNRDS
jgi:hypothetical protein